MTHIAFLGTGLMGAPMAANLLAAGYELTVWNRTPGKTQPLVDQGAQLADTPAAAVAGADAVLAMLSDGAAVDDLVETHGVADALAGGRSSWIARPFPRRPRAGTRPGWTRAGSVISMRRSPAARLGRRAPAWRSWWADARRISHAAPPS